MTNRLKPFIKRSRGNVEHIDKEIRHVAWLISDVARNTLPLLKPGKTNGFRDRTLSQLCARSKEAWRTWCSEGRPASGPLYDAKCTLRRQVRQRVKLCSAMEERKRVCQREALFRANSHLRFNPPQKRSKSRCTRLRMDNVIVSDPSLLLQAWTHHFQDLAKSQEEGNPALKESIDQCTNLLSTSFQKEEMFLDVGFGAEEVRDTVCRMKIKKSAGLDNLTAEHLKYGGNCIIIWLTEILNAIVDTEQIPACLKLGITIPIYKGGGKDPLNANSYRGITINSVISKVLDTLILDRLEPLFVEGGVPHPNQSAYRKHVSCMDAIFATQEVINRYLMEGGKMYMCLYDLEKAFDSVEFPVLLKRLFDVGINSKTWRILRSWYTDGHSSVCLGQHVSPPFALRRGVRQGSVLSPALFLLIMDPLLRQLQSPSIGASTNNMYAGGFLHADDIRTLAPSVSSLEAQISIVKRFTEDNFLKLNASKCEIVAFKKVSTSAGEERIEAGECSFLVGRTATCLGYQWKDDLSSSHAIQVRVQKARKAYFQYGSIYAFQGMLSPLSCCSIVETCILPILLYGVENWVLSPESVQMLESFQGEIAKRILRLPKWYSNTAAIIALGWNTLHSVCTIRKLKFLHRVMSNQESICHRAFSAMVDNVESLCLVRECRELEQRYMSNFTSAILHAQEEDRLDIIRNAGKSICKIDQSLLLQKTSDYPFLIQIAEGVGWKTLGRCARPWTPGHQGPEEPRQSDHIPQLFFNNMPTMRYTDLRLTNSD